MDLRTPAVVTVWLVAASCATPPAPPPGARVLQENPRAIVEGRVVDVDARPVAGLGVRALPRAAEVPWTPWVTTDENGRFRLVLYAPAFYGFLLRRGKTSIVTPDPRDPARLAVEVRPGQTRDGIELVYLEREWSRIIAEAPPPSR